MIKPHERFLDLYDKIAYAIPSELELPIVYGRGFVQQLVTTASVIPGRTYKGIVVPGAMSGRGIRGIYVGTHLGAIGLFEQQMYDTPLDLVVRCVVPNQFPEALARAFDIDHTVSADAILRIVGDPTYIDKYPNIGQVIADTYTALQNRAISAKE